MYRLLTLKSVSRAFRLYLPVVYGVILAEKFKVITIRPFFMSTKCTEHNSIDFIILLLFRITLLTVNDRKLITELWIIYIYISISENCITYAKISCVCLISIYGKLISFWCTIWILNKLQFPGQHLIDVQRSTSRAHSVT